MTDIQKVLQFDGTDDFVELAPGHLIGLGPGDFTVEAWVRIDAWGGLYLPILGTDTAASYVGLHLAIKDQRPYMGFYDSDTAGQTPLTLGVWYHLAWRFKANPAAPGTGEQAIFLNGVLDVSAAGRTAFAGDGETVLVGRYAVDHHFQGRLAELRVWSRARDAGEIFRDVHRRLTGGEERLAAYWPLDEGTGTQIANRRPARPAADHGAGTAAITRLLPDDGSAVPPPRLTLDGTGKVELPRRDDLELTEYTFETWIRPEVPSGDTVLLGRKRTARATFDGTGDKFSIEDFHYDSPVDAITVEAWIKTSKKTQGIIASWDRSEFWRLSVCNDAGLTPNGVYWATTHGAGNIDDMAGSVVVNDGQWHHVAVTYDLASGKKRIYVDGELDTERDASFTEALGSTNVRYGFLGVGSEAGVYNGTTGPDDYFQGQMAEVRIWHCRRTQAQIQAEMERRLRGDEDGLVAYWPLDVVDEATGLSPDASGHGYAACRRGNANVVDGDVPPLVDADLDLVVLQADGSLRHRALTSSGPHGPGDTPPLPVGVWSHVAVTHDGTTARTLLDGVETGALDTEALRPTRDTLTLFEGFHGALAETRLWNVARSPAEIAAGKGQQLTGSEPGLLISWPMDEGTGTSPVNQVPGGAAGTLTAGGSSLAWPESPYLGESALAFDGTAWLEVPHAAELHFGKADASFTLEAWVRTVTDPAASADDERVVVEKWSGIGSYPYALRYRPATGVLVFARSAGTAASTAELTCAVGTATAAWHHVAAVKAGTSLYLYVDGVLRGETADVTATIRGSSPIYVGSHAGTERFFDGAVTEMRLWSRARTATEIAGGRWLRLTGREDGLAGYWPLDAVTGGEAADGVPRPAGGISGAAWQDADDLPLVSETAETAPVVAFDGLAGSVTVAANAALMPMSLLTVEAWVRPEATGGEAYEGPVVTCGDAVGGWGLRATDRELGFLLTVDGRQHRVRWPSTAGAGRWVHVAGVYDGLTLQLYVDGVPVTGAREVVSGTVTPYAGDLTIGAHPYWPGRRFQGQVAEVRVWSSARTAVQIHQNLLRRLSGSELGLAGYWPLAGSPAAGGGVAGDGRAEDVTWPASDLPPRVAPAPAVAADSPERSAYLRARLEEIRGERNVVGSASQLLDLQRNELLRQLNEMKESIEGWRGELRAPFEEELALLDEQITGTEGRQAELDAAGVDAFLDHLVADAHKKIETAREELAKKQGSHGLQRASVQIKFVAGAGGEGAIFPPLDAAVEAAQISTLDLDFEPVGTAAVTETPKASVPSVVGLTRALAERRLQAAGFRSELHHQAARVVAGEPSPIGRVLSQLPRAGVESPPGSMIRLFLGKAS